MQNVTLKPKRRKKEVAISPEVIKVIEKLEEKGLSIIEHLNLILPEVVTIAYLSVLTGKDKSTIKGYLFRNFREGKDYFQRVKNGKIYVVRAAAVAIRDYYANKEKRAKEKALAA